MTRKGNTQILITTTLPEIKQKQTLCKLLLTTINNSNAKTEHSENSKTTWIVLRKLFFAMKIKFKIVQTRLDTVRKILSLRKKCFSESRNCRAAQLRTMTLLMTKQIDIFQSCGILFQKIQNNIMSDQLFLTHKLTIYFVFSDDKKHHEYKKYEINTHTFRLDMIDVMM